MKINKTIKTQFSSNDKFFKKNKNKRVKEQTHTLASSRPRSLTGVPDLGETKQPSDNSSRPIIRPGHHDPFRRRTQTNPPTDASMPLLLASPELPISTKPSSYPKEKKKNPKENQTLIQPNKKPMSTLHF